MYFNTYLLLVHRIGIFNSVSLYLSVVEHDTVTNLLDVMSSNVLVKIYVIYFLLEELRMSQLAGQVTVICQQKHTCGIAVETSNRIDSLRAGILYEIHDSLTLLRVVTCCNMVFRFVEQDINLFLQRNRLVVELYFIRAQYFGSKFGHCLSIDCDHTSQNELISLTTAAYSGIGKELVQTHRFHRIIVLFLILNALLHAILGIGIIVSRTRTETATLLLTIAATIVVVTATLLAITATIVAVTATLLAITATIVVVTATLLAITAFRCIFATIAVIAWTITATRLAVTVTGLLTVGIAWLRCVSAIYAIFTPIVVVVGTIATTILLVSAISATLLTIAAAIVVITTAICVISTLIVIARTILLTRLYVVLQSCTEPFGTEAAILTVVSVAVPCTLYIVRTCLIDARTR